MKKYEVSKRETYSGRCRRLGFSTKLSFINQMEIVCIKYGLLSIFIGFFNKGALVDVQVL